MNKKDKKILAVRVIKACYNKNKKDVKMLIGECEICQLNKSYYEAIGEYLTEPQIEFLKNVMTRSMLNDLIVSLPYVKHVR